MGNNLPYRAPVQTDRASPPAEFFCAWNDAEKQVRPVGMYYGLVFGLMGSGLLASAVPVAAMATAAATLAGVAWYARLSRRPLGVVLRVDDGNLSARQDDRLQLLVRLDAVRNVVVDSKSIRRVTYHQEVGAALPDTRLSGDVDIARIVFVCDDGQRLLLTEQYAAYSECMEQFGKVRVFLRKHGWLPEDERPKPGT